VIINEILRHNRKTKMIVYLSKLLLIFIKLWNMNHSPVGYDMELLRPCMRCDVVQPALFYPAKASITFRLPDRATTKKKAFFSSIAVCATVMFSQNYLKDISRINCKYP